MKCKTGTKVRNKTEKSMEEHEKWMRRCIELARKGRMGAPPNPMVGAVIVHEGRIIGEGYHRRCGEAHAEVNAVTSVRERHLLPHSTLYVSLEPCSHYGKTPPCAELIVRERIPEVVVGCIDPFSSVQGRGIARLREAGCRVVTDVCRDECVSLNRRFFTFHTCRRPYITLKWAQSADGYLDLLRTEGGSPVGLSTPHTRMEVHRLRTEHQAILVGGNTARLDNPSLTARWWPGPDPLRVIVAGSAKLPSSLRLFDGTVPTLLVCHASVASWYEGLPTVSLFVPRADEPLLPQLMVELHRRGIQSLLVEGGSITTQGFIDAGLWDEAVVEHAACLLGNGVPAPVFPPGVLRSLTTKWGVPFEWIKRT